MSTNYDWTSEEGQSILRMKYNLLSKYLKEHGLPSQGDSLVSEEFLNLAILEAYRLGNSDDIYRHEVNAGRFEKVINLQPYRGEVYEGTKEIEGFYDY